ncbi:hypothetical protein HK100_007591, partial [Physocladia obscura]
AGNLLFIGVNLGFLLAFAPAGAELPVFDDGARICENGVRSYLIGQIVLYSVYSLPQRPLQYYIENFNPEAKKSRLVAVIWALWSLFTLFDILWFFIGQYWVFSSSLCKEYDPPLYWLAISQIIFFYLTTIAPIFLYAVFVCVMRRRYIRNEMEEGTGPAAHLKGGLSKAELATLRTFIFKTSLPISPEEQESDDKDEEQGIIELDTIDSAKIAISENETHENQVTEIQIVTSAMDSAESHLPATDGQLGTNDKGKSPARMSPQEPTTTNIILSKKSSLASKKHNSVKISSEGSPSSSPATELPTVGQTPAIIEADLPTGASTNCAICFCDFEAGDVIRELACHHIFHVDCIDPWLIVPDAPSAPSSSKNPPHKAHRTCPLCVQEVILPEFRDKDVELAMELQKKEESEMQQLLERLKKEAEEEQALIEKRRKKAEERKQRRANGRLSGLLSLGRGRSRTVDPTGTNSKKSNEGAMKRSTSIDVVPNSIADLDGESISSSTVQKTPQERLSTIKMQLESIKSKLIETQDGANNLSEGVVEDSLASANAIALMIQSVQDDLEEEENAENNAENTDNPQTEADGEEAERSSSPEKNT